MSTPSSLQGSLHRQVHMSRGKTATGPRTVSWLLPPRQMLAEDSNQACWTGLLMKQAF